MIYGLHISTAGNLAGTPARARAMGAGTIQIFASSPRMWKSAHYSAEQGAAFHAACADARINPVFIHNVYLANFGTENEELAAKSVAATRSALQAADTLGVKGVITHLGSHKGGGFEAALPRVAANIADALKGSKDSLLILENTAGSGGNIGDSLEEIAAIIKSLHGDKRLAVCIDTAHALAAGYELRTKAGLKAFLDRFDELIGLDRLVAMHLNDSKIDLGGRRDRHENIGHGHIGDAGWRVILNEPRLKNIPGLLEVPGMDGESGPDTANLEKLRSLTD